MYEGQQKDDYEWLKTTNYCNYICRIHGIVPLQLLAVQQVAAPWKQ